MWSVLHEIAAGIGLRLHLLYRMVTGKANAEYIAYRTGRKIGELSNGGEPAIWFHGVSVGEVAALDSLIGEVRKRKPKVPIAVSTMTSDGLHTIRKLANQPEFAFIYPIDSSRNARRVVENLRPAVLVIVDGDFWFQMLRACRRPGVPMVVMNGRLSERSLRRHLRFPSYAREMFAGITLVSAQSKMMADRFAQFIDPKKIVVDGNVKLDAPLPRVTEDFGIDRSRFCFVFGSVHPAEIEAIAGPIGDVLAKHPEAQIVIAPRHPDKFTSPPIPHVIWINRLGVLRQLYQLCDAAFVGGTFCEVGGHNLAEPALAGKPVVYGPDVHSQVPLDEILQSYKASMQVKTSEELGAAMMKLMEDRALRETMGRNGERLRADSQGLAGRLAERILRAANVI